MKRFFDSELETLRSDLFRMGEQVIAQLRLALRALAESDQELADQVIEADQEIDDLEVRIDEEAIRYISLRSPIATALRTIVTGMKASHDFERAADEVTKIARRIRHLRGAPLIKTSTDLVAMGSLAAEMLHDAMDCFIEENEEKAVAVCQRDQEVDQMNRELQNELTQLMMRSPEHVAPAVDLIFISKALERVADHATNIAEETVYLFKAKDLRHTPEVKRAPEGAETAESGA